MSLPSFLNRYKHLFKGAIPPEETGYAITSTVTKAAVTSVLDAVAVSGASVLSSAAGILAAAVIVFSGYTLYDTAYTTNQAFSTWDDIKIQDIIENNTPEQSYEAIKSAIGETQANDLRGWIAVYDTYINYPLMQGADDLYYVSHDYKGESSLSGSIYLASANSPGLEDAYNIIYGHHMDNGAMFGSLDGYVDPETGTEFFNSHREGLVVTTGNVYDMKVFAAIRVDAYNNDIYGVAKYAAPDQLPVALNCIKAAAEESGLYYDETVAASAEKIVGMSTCADATTNGRIVIYAALTLHDPLALQMEETTIIYDGLPHSITVTTNHPDTTTVEYSTDGGETWTTDPPEYTNAGSYEIKVRATDPTNGTSEATATLVINRRPVTVTANSLMKLYSELDPEYTVTIEGALASDANDIEYTIGRSGMGTVENVGTYYNAIEITGPSVQLNGNYNVTFVYGNFVIEKAPMIVKAETYTHEYDGQLHLGDGIPSVTEGTTLWFKLTEAPEEEGDEGNGGAAYIWSDSASATALGYSGINARLMNDPPADFAADGWSNDEP